MNQGIAIRGAAAQDEAAVVALWRACGLVVSWNDPVEDFRFARGRDNSDILVGVAAGDRIVGSVMVGHDGHRGWLYYLATDPGWRRRGVGRSMVRAAEDWLRERRVPKVQLMVRETNTAVVAFYERLGFETMPRVLMQRWLRDS